MDRMPIQSPTGRVALEVLRDTGGHYDDDGIWVDGVRETVYVTANVQPANRFNLQQQLKEGDRSRSSILILSYDPLYTADDRANPLGNPQVKTKADIVVWKGKYWELRTSDSYEMGVLDHWECIAILMDDFVNI